MRERGRGQPEQVSFQAGENGGAHSGAPRAGREKGRICPGRARGTGRHSLPLLFVKGRAGGGRGKGETGRDGRGAQGRKRAPL